MKPVERPWSVRASARLYRLLLLLYPAAFRRAFADEITDAFTEHAVDSHRRSGVPGLILIWPRTLADLVRGGLGERVGSRRRRSSAIPTAAELRARRLRAAADLRASNSPPRRTPAMDTLAQDLRFAARTLRRSPAFTIAIVATIALGVGANTAIFTLVDGIVLRPLPFPDSERAVALCERSLQTAGYCVASPPNVADLASISASLEEAGVARTWQYSLHDDDGRTNISAGIATPGYLRAHGATPALGRLLEEGDMPSGSNRVVVLTHGLWRGRFGGDPEIIGRQLRMDGEPYTVIGVLAAETWVSQYGWVEAWTPLTATPDNTDQRDWRGFAAVARLAPGVTLEQARGELEGVHAALRQEYPEANRGWELHVGRLRDQVTGPVRSTLMIFSVAVGCVLLIGCANVANLLLVRATERGPEFAVRASLGAGKRRIVRQLLTESVILALVGGGFGLALAAAATRAFVRLAPQDIPRLTEVSIDVRVLAFTALVSAITALLFGLAPALRAARTDISQTLKSARTGDAGVRGLRNALVVAQIALAMVLLVVAGLLTGSFASLLGWEPGFDREGLLTVWSYADFSRFSSGREIVEMFDQTAAEILAIPGVSAVGQTSGGPLFGGIESSSMIIEGRPPLAPEERPTVRYYNIGPGYFAAMGIPVVRGRSFTDQDTDASVQVAMVNETFVARHFPRTDPIGELVTIDERTMQIVGVTRDVRPFRPDQAVDAEIFYPNRQFTRGGMYFVVRSGLEPGLLESQIRDKLGASRPDLVLSSFRTLAQRTESELVSPRFNAALIGLFALAAVALAAIGIYGVIAYAVASRTHEIGVRIAIGARPGVISAAVVRSGLGLALIGSVLGVAAALALGRLVASQLHGISAYDAPTYVVVVAFFLLVTLVACWLPARRAARLDPVAALRNE